MANHLSMAKVNGILELHQAGWSQRRIAETLGIDRKTVGLHLSAEAAKRAKATTGEAPTGSEVSKRAKAPTGSDSETSPPLSEDSDTGSSQEVAGGEDPGEREDPGEKEEEESTDRATFTPGRSLCSNWQSIIEEKLDQGLTAQRIHQDLVADHGFQGKYPSVRRFVARLSSGRPLPFRRMEVVPGQEAQVDFGTGVTLRLWLVGIMLQEHVCISGMG